MPASEMTSIFKRSWGRRASECRGVGASWRRAHGTLFRSHAPTLPRSCAPTLSQPHDLLEQGGGGLPGHKGNDHDLAARLLDCAAFVLVQRIQGIIAALHLI